MMRMFTKAMFVLKLLLLNLLVFGHAQALSLDDLQKTFSQIPVQRADFEQIRQISGMAQPLRSSGSIIIAQKQGLWWSQQKPFAMTLLLNENRMVQAIAGQKPQIITASSNPQMFQFNKLLTALFHADRAVLEQNFRLDFTDLGKQGWRLKLTPKAAPLDKLFRQLVLTGDRYLNSIEINDMQGDQSRIRFFNHKTQPLTNEELRNFSS